MTEATGRAEREAAVSIEVIPGRYRITVGADKAYDTNDSDGSKLTNDPLPSITKPLAKKRNCRTT
ncbi:hypothetical protein FHS63_005258 [Azospirillum doebereinerae]